MLNIEHVENEFYEALSGTKDFKKALTQVVRTCYQAGLGDLSSSTVRRRHIKTGNMYLVLGYAKDCTNERNGTDVVMYCREGCPEQIYVREWEEFCLKFEEVE